MIYDIRKKQYNQRFLLCATHYPFTLNVCNPSSPHEKGSTEKSVSVVRKAAFSEKIRFNSLADANDHLTQISDPQTRKRGTVPYVLIQA
jgi:transposase